MEKHRDIFMWAMLLKNKYISSQILNEFCYRHSCLIIQIIDIMEVSTECYFESFMLS